MRKRITIEFDPDLLSFSDLRDVSEALAVLEGMSSSDVISMDSITLKVQGTRKSRSDRKQEKALQPQAEAVLGFMRQQTEPKSVTDVAASLGLNPNSVRAQLHVLADRGLVAKAGMVESSGTRPASLWMVS